MRLRKPRRAVLFAALGAAVATCLTPAHAYVWPGTIDRISVGPGGVSPNDNSAGDAYSRPLSTTPDGRYVAFDSAASNLVPGDLDKGPDVFVRDTWTGKTVMASAPLKGTSSAVVASASLTCNEGAIEPSVSATGRYVAFASCYPYLDGKPAPLGAVFVHDMLTGATTRISVTPNLAVSTGSAYNPSISGDGRYVAFESNASDLVAGSCTGTGVTQLECSALGVTSLQVYVRDTRTNVTKLVSHDSSGGPADHYSFRPQMSQDGRYVVFISDASFVTADTNVCTSGSLLDGPSCPDVYVRDLKTDAIRLVSVGLNGRTGPGGSGFVMASMSANDRYVVYTSESTGLVPNDTMTGAPTDVDVQPSGIYVRDLVAQQTERISVDASGRPYPNGGQAAIDATGRHVIFDGWACIGADGQEYGYNSMHDRITGATVGISPLGQVATGQGASCPSLRNAGGYRPVVSETGRYVAFAGQWGNVPGDSSGHIEVFRRDLGSLLGVGDLATAPRLSLRGVATFTTTGLVTRAADRRATAVSTEAGDKLDRATLIYRPANHDLFIRIQVRQMPIFALASSAMVYGLNLAVGGERYQVRAVKTGALTASFGLFRLDRSGKWSWAGWLTGGYGTTGQEVVVALPLRDIQAQSGAHLSSVTAFSGLGSLWAGPSRTFDRVALSS
jgi:Tol biopolymer transport system component